MVKRIWPRVLGLLALLALLAACSGPQGGRTPIEPAQTLAHLAPQGFLDQPQDETPKAWFVELSQPPS
jgi:hypothetical protein